jgi:TetR/AcrR family transcriptional regulator, mexJK operon transcriptional repressor
MELAQEKPALSRREARRNDRREAILAVAYATFLEHGYADTSMSAIAATVGGSKATLWSYFPSKAELFAAVLDQATTIFRQQLVPLLDPGADPEQTFRRFCLRFLEKVTRPEAIALHRLVHAQAGRFPEMGAIFYERGPRTTQRLLGTFIESAMERGLLRRADPVQAAKLLTTICMSGCHNQLLLGRIDEATPEMIEADAEMAVDAIMRAYAPPRD